MTSNRWDQPGVPQRGWRCVGYADLEEATHTCEMCGTEEIRYVHTMVHSEFSQQLEVGCICAEKMEAPYEGSRRPALVPDPSDRERSMRGRTTRKRKWLTRKWRPCTGGHFLRTQGLVFIVKGAGDRWHASAKLRADEWVYPERRSYRTEDEAKLAIFDRLWPARVVL